MLTVAGLTVTSLFLWCSLFTLVSKGWICLTSYTKPFERGWLFVHIQVRDNNVEQAIRVLKKKLQREGIFREMKMRRAYEKPSERRVREKAEALRRMRKLMRKRLEREGY